MTQPDENLIEADPTKEFFIYMLVKDIEVEDAILDLVDNCVDGARRVRGLDASSGSYAGLWVRLEVDGARFIISDNCGGIDVDLAQHYAFRFGRPTDMGAIAFSVGQFGVGMKRALFKLGSTFAIESRTPGGRFKVIVDVEEWKREPGWHFRFAELDRHAQPQTPEPGTRIEVSELHPSLVDRFASEVFVSSLFATIASRHRTNLDLGLAITLNQIDVTRRPSELLATDALRPVSKAWVIDEGGAPVNVKIFAGVGGKDSEPGWYVSCNGRLIVEADQTNRTGWGEGGGRIIPHYHPQFAQFRGYAYLDSEDSSRLPWNTTKTGVDLDSPVFRAVREEMILAMRPVIDFLNALDRANDEGDDSLRSMLEKAPAVAVREITTTEPFTAPTREQLAAGKPATVSIQYRRLVSEVERVKHETGTASASAAGEATFQYFFDIECAE